MAEKERTMDRTMTVDLDKMADRVAEKALDEFTYKDKTIREWVELMVTVESVVEVRMVEEFEKIRAEIENHCGLAKEDHCKYCSYCNNLMGVREILEIIDKYKAEREELKGENK